MQRKRESLGGAAEGKDDWNQGENSHVFGERSGG